MSEVLFEVNNLSCSYGQGRIIDTISFSMLDDSFTFILSPNNTGKTTLIKTLCGMNIASGGTIKLKGITLNKMNLNWYLSHISTVLEDIDNNFLFDKVVDELEYPLENLEFSRTAIKKIVQETADIMNIESIMNSKISNLSKYDKVKVLIAASIVHRPNILFLDDILRFLSINEKKEIIRLLRKINKEEHIAILMTTSDINDVIDQNDIILLKDHKVEIRDRYSNIILKDNDLTKMGFSIPIMVDLSRKLQFYNLVDSIFYNRDKVVDKLWK